MKRFICILAILGFVPLAWTYTSITDADTGLPIRWSTSTVPIKIMADSSTVLSDGKTRATCIQAAMQDVQRGWNHYLGSTQLSTQIVPPGSGGANGNQINEIFFSNTAYGQNWDSNTLAVTTGWYTGTQRKEADIIFNTAFTWDSYRGASRANTVAGPYDIQRVAFHELGHVLGLDHPDQAGQSTTAIMNSIIGDIDSLQPDDIGGAQSLYGIPGSVPGNDNFANATIITPANGSTQLSGTNFGATKESGESTHAGDVGGHSVWWKWTAPGVGNVTVTTLGSNFDTVLGVYTGSSVAALSAVASNDDVNSATVRTSSVTFDSTTGATYSIAVDGKTGVRGMIVVGLSFTSTVPPPVFTKRPLTRSLTVGDSVTFQAAATGNGSITYQWKRNGVIINGASGPTFALSSVALSDNGFYEVSVADLNGAASSLFQVHVVPPNMAVTGWGYDVYGQASSFPSLTSVVAVTGGYTHTLALKADGTVAGFGTSGFPESIVPAGLSGVVAIAAQGNTSMALKSDGTVMVWGNNNYGQNTIPPGVAQVISIATGSTHCLALKADGTVLAWGDNAWGKTTVPTGLTGVVAIDAGTDHSIALKADGTVVVWGQNINYGSVVPPAGLSGVVAIAAGSYHNLALKADGSILAWGFNPVGQTTIPAGAAPAVAIAAGSSHSLALKANGSVVGWGYVNSGLGLDQSPPGLGFVYGIGTGDNHNLVLVAPVAPVITGQPANQTVDFGGTITLTVAATGIPTPSFQWRKNGVPVTNGGRVSGATSRTLSIATAQGSDAGNYDVLLNNVAGNATSQAAVVTVTLPPSLTVRPPSRIILAGQPMTLDATAQGGVTYSWVRNGQLLPESGSQLHVANASVTDNGYYDVTIANSAGTTRTIFYVRVAQQNALVAWGGNGSGQISVPSGLANVVDLSAGVAHTLALKADGKVAAWGSNANGQTNVPTGLLNVVQVSSGASHSVALKADGTVVAWGLNSSGQCTVPAGLTGVVQVSAGGSNTLALKNDGTLVAWGGNSDGQTTVPTNLSFIHYVSAGLTHSVALTDLGIVAWGRNNFGQSAPNNYTLASAVQAAADHTVFIDMTGHLSYFGKASLVPMMISDAAALSIRDTHGLSIQTDGTVIAWGSNASGENILPEGLGNVQMVAAGTDFSVAAIARQAPTIFTQPIDVTTSAGGTTVFTVSAGGAVTYHWMHDGVDLTDNARFTGTAGPTLTITTVQAGDAGHYAVRLTNTFGSVTSRAATLTVPALLITNNGGIAANADGSLVTLSVGVTGAGPYTYQWYAGLAGDTSGPIAGANSSSVTVPQTGVQNFYWVRVSNGVTSADSISIPLGKWKVIDPLFGSAGLSAAAYGGGKYVVVGTGVGHSANAIDWQVDTIEAGADLHAVFFDGTRFVAGGVRGQVFSSADGTAWQKLRAADAGQYSENVLSSGACGNGISVFAGARGQVMSSTDGTNWAWRPVGANGEAIDLVSVAFGAGRFVAVGQNAAMYASVRIYQSVNGINWSPVVFSVVSPNPSYVLSSLNQVMYFGGRFVAMGQSQYGGTAAYVLTSADGINWNAPVFTNVPVVLDRLTKSDGQLLSGDLRSSADGVNWSAPLATLSQYPQRLAGLGYGNGIFLYLNGPYDAAFSSILTSTDLANWTARVGFGVPSNVAYGNGRFVGVSRDRTEYSLDGVNWTVTGTAGFYDYGPVTFGNGIFVSTSTYSGYGKSHFTSTDGVTWTTRQIVVSGQTQTLSLAMYAGGQWIATTGSAIFTSSDAINWTLRYASGSIGMSAMAYGGGRYVTVGNGGGVLISNDGISWSAPLRPTTRNFQNLAYGAGVFVATDTESGLWSSPDGLQWTGRTLPGKSGGSYLGYISSLVYGSDRFLASYGSDILSSTDGITWQVTPTALPPPTDGNFFTGNLVFGAGSFWATGSVFSGPSLWLRMPVGPAATEIVMTPADVVVTSGHTATLTVSASGSGLTYQWFKGLSGNTAQPIAAATSASYTTPGLTQSSHFWVRVTGTGGTVNSPTVTVAIGTTPVISTQPVDADILAGTPANLGVIATGTPAPTYQWYLGGTGDTTRPISSATSGGYAPPATITTVQRYWVRVSNPLGSVDSDAAVVTPWLERPALGTLSPFVFLNGRYIGWTGDRLTVSQNAIDWSVIGTNVPPLTCLTYGAGLYVGFRNASFIGIYTSPDLLNWTLRANAPGFENYSVTSATFGSGRFVGGSARGGVIVSTDGINWTRSNFNVTESNVQVSSVMYDGNVFLAAGDETPTDSGVVLRSSDGLTWSRTTLPTMESGTQLRTITRAGARLYAFGEFGQTSYTSTDGLTWVALSVPGSRRIKSVAWLSGVYLLGTDGDRYYSSADGLNWTEHTSPADLQTFSLISVPGQILAAGSGSINVTTDGLNWTLRAQTPNIGTGISGIAFGNGRFAISGSWSDDYYSADGVVWPHTQTPIGIQQGGRMIFGAGHFVCTDNDSPGKLWTSSDGSNWQALTIPGISHTFNAVGFANGLFFALGSGGQYATSPDGSTWTVRSVGLETFLYTVAYGNGRYVIAGSWKVWTSTDMATWTESPVAGIGVQGLEFAQGRFVAVAIRQSGSQGVILTSADGSAWTERFVCPGNEALYGLAFDGNRFAATGSGPLLLSKDGLNWVRGPVTVTQIAAGNGTFIGAGYRLWQSVSESSVVPSIQSQPSARSIHWGENVAFDIAVTGTNLVYQWRRNGVGLVDGPDITGAHSATLLLSTSAASVGGTYTVVVTNAVGSVTSQGAVLTLFGPPAITTQPLSQTATAGTSVTFSATAIGAPNLACQWQKNGVNLSGEMNDSYTISNVEAGDAGSYRMIATNSSGTVASVAAVLTVTAPNYTAKAAAADFDRDGQSDLVWQNTLTGERSFWLMNGTILKQGVGLGTFAPDWTVAGSGDFNGDGQADLLWQNTITGERSIWLMNGTSLGMGVDFGTYSTDIMIVASGDFNGDGQTDIVWQNISTGARGVWLMHGTTKTGDMSLGTVSTAWAIAGTGDFNGDGQLDLIWQNGATGERSVWLMNGTVMSSAVSLGIVPRQMQIVGTGDYNHDGKTDLIWTDTETGERWIWLMNGLVPASKVKFTLVSVEWSLGRPIFLTAQTAHADFNADGQTDIVWQNHTTGERKIWLMNGQAKTSEVSLGTIATNWVISGTGDFNHDDKPDLVWTNTTTGDRTVWLMDGTTMLSAVPLTTISPVWAISAIGDFNYDGKPDLVWANTVTGERAIWLMNGTVFGSGISLGTIPAAWKIATTADLNGDGKTDLVWQNASTGERSVWLMNGGAFTAGVALDTLPVQWSIVGSGDFNADGKADLLLQNTTTGERAIRMMDRTAFLSTVSLGISDTHWSIRN